MAEFRISTNIKRDANANLDYIVTKNANDVYERIIRGYGKGQKSFTIIGSYGTGKSTFLWAFENHLKGNLKFSNPVNGEFKGNKSFVFKRIVGESISLKEQFCKDVLDIDQVNNRTNKDILKEFDSFITNQSNKTIVLMFDEFGKHLEYIAKYEPEEMYFIQELAEYCNDPSKPVLFITTLHQNFSVYAKGLSKEHKNEWDKVRGRLIDVTFDEPIEQLLYFASKRLESIKVPKNLKTRLSKVISVLEKSALLGRKKTLSEKHLEKLYPLDPLSADILVKSLQKYGQNERSLFTFLESKELETIVQENSFFTVPDCFDYLINSLSTEIEDGEKNPFKPQWKSAILAMDKAEFIFEENYIDAAKIIKLICLVNIFSNINGTLNNDVIEGYAKNVLGIKTTSAIIETLVAKKIIRYSIHRSKYNFTDGTDLDLELELIKAAQRIDRDVDLVARLDAYFNLGIIPAKKVQYEYGVPRFFKFRFRDDIGYDDPKEEIDGYINLIFTKDRILTALKEFANEAPTCQIFVLFKEIDKIEETLFEIDKINHVISKFEEDRVALRILNEEKEYRRRQLEKFVQHAMFSEETNVTWIWNKDLNKENFPRKITSMRRLNKLLSVSAEMTYGKTPRYLNEMVNKQYLSTPILTARKALIRRLISNSAENDLGFEEKRFPPEKTIYLSLLKKTGLHKKVNGVFTFDVPSDESFIPLWFESERILKGSIESKMKVEDFYKTLSKPPFKLKKGFLDYWIPIFLIIKKEEYSLYHQNGEYIPHLTDEVMDLIYKNPTKYLIKALSLKGVKSEYLSQYKELVGYNESNISGLESSYITIYGNFLRFYRGLDDYTKNTKSISKAAREVRDAIEKARDPETALFEKIPEALGYIGELKEEKGSEAFLKDLQETIKILRETYNSLVESLQASVEEFLGINTQDFMEFKERVSEMFASVNPNLIQDRKLKVFYQRVTSPLDVKKAYWESLCDATLGKKLDKIKDEEVQLLIDRMEDNFQTLLNLGEIHQFSGVISEDVKQITILGKSAEQNIKKILLKKDQNIKEVNELREKLTKVLGNSKDEITQLALLELLEEKLK